ncbi:MAG: hypothetical protein WCI71_08520, partial [Bacteroidota bacterium]
MKLPLLLLCLILLFHVDVKAQSESSKLPVQKEDPPQKKAPLFGITFSGYVKTDIYLDSRQTVGLRESQFLLFPEAVKPDADGNDINAKANYNILSIQTRLAGSITGPDALGAKTSGYIEAEFFGNINPAINSFRLRHAWVKLAWPKAELLVGQWWHPMFVPECAPATVSFNTGAPFVVFSRNPQIKLTRAFNHFRISLTALSQIDFVSDGPQGASPKYARNSVLPELDLQIQYGTRNEERGTEFLVGAGINFLMLTPRLSTDVVISKSYDTVINNLVFHHETVVESYKTNAKSNAFAGNIYAKLKLRKVTMKVGGEYGDNNYSYTMIGGYAVKSITDVARGFVDYSNIRSFAVWGEFHTNGQKWQPGLFCAYGRNLGSAVSISGPWYTRGNNIDYLYRISPRILLNVQKFRFATEIEYTVAAYGTTTGKGYVSDSKETGNLRVLLGV